MDFMTLAMDALVNQAAKARFMFGGQRSVPMVLRTPHGGGLSAGPQHSQCLEAWFAHVPGLKVVCPSEPADAYGAAARRHRRSRPGDLRREQGALRHARASCRSDAADRADRQGRDRAVPGGTPRSSPMARRCGRRSKRPSDARRGAASRPRCIDLRSAAALGRGGGARIVGANAPPGRRARGGRGIRHRAPRSRRAWRMSASTNSTARSCASARRSCRCRSRRAWRQAYLPSADAVVPRGAAHTRMTEKTMSDDAILYETRGAVALITINRPKTLNALDIADTRRARGRGCQGGCATRRYASSSSPGAGDRLSSPAATSPTSIPASGLAHYSEFAERIHRGVPADRDARQADHRGDQRLGARRRHGAPALHRHAARGDSGEARPARDHARAVSRAPAARSG